MSRPSWRQAGSQLPRRRCWFERPPARFELISITAATAAAAAAASVALHPPLASDVLRAPLAARSRLTRLGVLDEAKQQLDYVLALKPADFLERRLQTQVFKLGLAKSIHHARVLIRHRHIRVGKQIVNIPSFMVRTDSQKHIDFAVTSPYGGGRPGRNKRKAIASKGGGGGGGDDDEDM